MGEKHNGVQGALWHDSILDALATDIAAAGGFKKLGPVLYPHLGVETAASRLRNAVNSDQQHKLCPQQQLVVMAKAREVGSIATLTYIGRELGCEITALAAPEAKKRAKKARIAAVLDELGRLLGDE